MKKYLSSCFLIFLSLSLFSQQSNLDQSKAAILEKIHWIIERSDMNKVRAEFNKICTENQFPSLISGLKDGNYTGTSPADDFGYRHVVVFEMKDGKMIAVDYDEVHTDGHAKQSDEAYGKEMMEGGTSPAIAYPEYEKQMLRKQDLNQIDAVSGASYSSYRFKLAILYAILNSGQL